MPAEDPLFETVQSRKEGFIGLQTEVVACFSDSGKERRLSGKVTCYESVAACISECGESWDVNESCGGE